MDNSEIELQTWLPTTDYDQVLKQHESYVMYMSKLKSAFSGKYFDRVSDGLSKTLTKLSDSQKYLVEKLKRNPQQNDSPQNTTWNTNWSKLANNQMPKAQGTQTIPLDQLDPKGHAQIESEYIDPRELAALQDRLKMLSSSEGSNVHKDLNDIYQEMLMLQGMQYDKPEKIKIADPSEFSTAVYDTMEGVHQRTKHRLATVLGREKLAKEVQTTEKIRTEQEYRDLQDALAGTKAKLEDTFLTLDTLKTQIQNERKNYSEIQNESAVKMQEIGVLRDELKKLKIENEQANQTILANERTMKSLQDAKKEAMAEIRKCRFLLSEKDKAVQNLQKLIAKNGQALDELQNDQSDLDRLEQYGEEIREEDNSSSSPGRKRIRFGTLPPRNSTNGNPNIPGTPRSGASGEYVPGGPRNRYKPGGTGESDEEQQRSLDNPRKPNERYNGQRKKSNATSNPRNSIGGERGGRNHAWQSNNKLPKNGVRLEEGDYPEGEDGHVCDGHHHHNNKLTGSMSPGHSGDSDAFSSGDEGNGGNSFHNGRKKQSPGRRGGKQLTQEEIEKIMEENSDMTYEEMLIMTNGDASDEEIANRRKFKQGETSPYSSTSPGRRGTRRSGWDRLATSGGKPFERSPLRFGTVPDEIWIGHTEGCGANCEHLRRAMEYRRWKEIGQPLKMTQASFMYNEAEKLADPQYKYNS